MATNLVIESPDFDRIRKGDGRATEDAVRLLWYALNDLSLRETTDVVLLRKTAQWEVHSDAPTANQDNYDSQGQTVLLFTGGTAFNLTGIRNGITGQYKVIANLGVGTITVKHEVTSDAANRIDTAAAADKAVATNKFMLLQYLNSRWREISLA